MVAAAGLALACSVVVAAQADGDLEGPPSTFACHKGGEVVPWAYVQDGVCDCCDGSDEGEDAGCGNVCVERIGR